MSGQIRLYLFVDCLIITPPFRLHNAACLWYYIIMEKQGNNNGQNCPKEEKKVSWLDKLTHVHGEECMTKNAAEYERAKLKRKIRRIIAFSILCAVIAGVYTAAFIIDNIFAYYTRIAIIAREYIIDNNGPRIIQTVITVVLGFAIITAITFAMRLFARGANKRRRTIVSLIASLTKYIGYIIVIIMLFGVWDVDTAILAAAIAALGLALGFGAQGLISDLLTGLFLIFENNIQVGDIVTIDSFRGEIEDIGIRTSRIRSPLGDVLVLNNGELKKFVNMTMHRSIAVCDVTISYGENIERVEKIINNSLEPIADKFPVITDGPFYKGVAELNEKGVTLRILAKVHESERIQLIRDLNREFKLIFDSNNISMAVPKLELVSTESVQVPKSKTTKGKK